MRVAARLALAATIALVACSVRVEPVPPDAAPRSTIRLSPVEPALKSPSAPAGAKVFNQGLKGSEARIARAVRDLKKLGFWKRLTRHLYVVQIGSRPGVTNVPEDNHLADAFLRGFIDDEGQGALCDILFFPAALRRDLANWRSAHARGLIGEPPTEREYWAIILGHELAHCLGHGKGEAVARRWEERIFRKTRSS